LSARRHKSVTYFLSSLPGWGISNRTQLRTGRDSEFDGIVHQTALGATGEIDIWIIGVNVSASSATINAIFALGRLKATPAEFGIDAHGR